MKNLVGLFSTANPKRQSHLHDSSRLSLIMMELKTHSLIMPVLIAAELY